MKTGTFFLTVATLVSVGKSFAVDKVNCYSTGGGYLTQGLRVEEQGDGALTFKVARFSPVPNLVPGAGIALNGELAKTLMVSFPKEQCITKPTAQEKITLIFCHTGISNISARVQLLDGTEKTVKLGDNNRIEIYQTDTNSVFETETKQVVSASLQLGSEPVSSQVGFAIDECR